MKATLHFDLETPEGRADFEAAVGGANCRHVLRRLDNELRGWVKYGHSWSNADEAIEAARTQLYELLAEYRIDID